MADIIKNKKNMAVNCAVLALLLLKYSMIIEVEKGGAAAVWRMLFAFSASMALIIISARTYSDVTSGFSREYKYAAVMLVAEPLLFVCLKSVWSCAACIIVLLGIKALNNCQSEAALVKKAVVFTAISVFLCPEGVLAFTAFFVFYALVHGAFSSDGIIKKPGDAVLPAIACILTSAVSFAAGVFLKNCLEYTQAYNYLPYSRIAFGLIGDVLNKSRSFGSLTAAILAAVPSFFACLLLIAYANSVQLRKSEQQVFLFRRKLFITAVFLFYAAGILGFILFYSDVNIALFVLFPLLILLEARRNKTPGFEQAFNKLESGMVSYPAAFALSVVYTAAFFAAVNGGNNLFFKVTDYLV